MRSFSVMLLSAVAFMAQQTVADHGCSKTSDGWGTVDANALSNEIISLRSTPDNSVQLPTRGVWSADVNGFQLCIGNFGAATNVNYATIGNAISYLLRDCCINGACQAGWAKTGPSGEISHAIMAQGKDCRAYHHL